MLLRPFLLFSSLSIATLLPNTAAFASTSKYKVLADNFKHNFHSKMKANKVPGGAFVIVEGDTILKLSTYGKRTKGGSKNVNSETVFRLASVSKTFAGTLASMLVQEHKLDWKQPVISYIPEFDLADKQAAKQINLGHIIGHSTGLWPNSYDNLINANVKMPKIISKFDELTPMCSPGVCYGYQNVAFSFIQTAIEAQTHQNYAELFTAQNFYTTKNEFCVGRLRRFSKYEKQS